jgi:tRNA (guanine10-N2)-methyltransferase
MANQAMCTAGDLVFDPFVGTGSIALACQHFGSSVLGSDIDPRVLYGQGVGHKSDNKGINGMEKIGQFDIHTNFEYYKLPMPDILAMDISQQMINAKRPIFNSIVCDPPYGIKVRPVKTGGVQKPKAKANKEDEPYYSQKSVFNFDELHV